MPANDITTAIFKLDDVDDVDLVMNAASERRKQLAKQVALSLKRGDKIKINDKVKPRYLAGTVVTVVSHNRETVVVNFDEPVGRYHGEVRLPVNLIGDKVEGGA